MPAPERGIGHAEMQLGDSRIMLADEAPKMDAYGPNHYKGSPVTLHVYLPDVDAITKQATAPGVTLVRPLTDQFYGDHNASLRDPFGHKWCFSTHVRDVSMRVGAARRFGSTVQAVVKAIMCFCISSEAPPDG